MRVQSTVTLSATPTKVFPFVSDLARYREWMPLVYSAHADGDAAWVVELRAKVGPFARSKRLRMERTTCIVPAEELAVDSVSLQNAKVVFERRETDGKKHSPWILTVDVVSVEGSTRVDVDLEYQGSLWTGGVLEQVLHNNINAGREGLRKAVGE